MTESTTRRYALTPRAQLIHHVMRVHRRVGPHTCSCTFEYPLGQDTTLHAADAVDAALAMIEQGLSIDEVDRMITDLEHHLERRRLGTSPGPL